MPKYRLTRKADDDLKQVYLYSYEYFGQFQADTYYAGLTACSKLLAEQPRIGYVRTDKPDTLRAFVHRSHIIAYRIAAADIVIQRVLDVRRDWERVFRAE